MKNKVIVISGTPGVGKEKLARKLSKELRYKRIDLHDYYQKISLGYDKSKKCYDIDLKKFFSLVTRLKKENSLVVDSHIGHLLPARLVDLCVVLTCSNLKKLEKSLQARKYNKKKVRENLDVEIFQICIVEAKEKHQVLMFDICKTSQKNMIDAINKEINNLS
tara:strand:- start:5610 stop:6098 length:489 start_codon:yes stop_codon:yes gene_type:complete